MPESPYQQKCTVCFHTQAEEINHLIAEGVGCRDIGARYGLKFNAVNRHTRNHLKKHKADFHLQQKAKNAFAFGEELVKRYKQAIKMLDAVEKWLTDPENPDLLDISPRDTELMVVYMDYNDRNERNKPTRKKAKLSDLLKDTMPEGTRVVEVKNLAMDNRKLFIEAFKMLTDRLEQIGKFYDYWKATPVQPLSEETERLRMAIEARAQQMGTTYEAELRFFLALPVADTIRPEIKAQLASNLVQ